MATGKNTKLLIITDTFYPHWTGISKSIYNLTQAIKNDFSITVLTVAHDKKLPKTETISGIKVLREPYIFILSRSHYSVSILLTLFRIINKYDVIFINTPSANILPFSFIAKLFGKKLLIFHQGDLLLPKNLKNWIIERIYDICTFYSLSMADKVATYTKDYALNSRNLKPHMRKFHPLLLPVYPKSSKTEPRNDKKKGEVIFGFGGRFVEEKGFDILFAAIPEIKKSFPVSQFLFAGEAHMAYEDFFRTTEKQYKSIKKDITLLGLLSDTQLTSFYKKIDFLIIPSRSDCFNMMQAEAMVSETPCISSNIPGLRFMINTTGFGVLFEKEDSLDLAKKVIFAVAKRKDIMLEYNNVLTVLEDKTNVDKIRYFITK